MALARCLKDEEETTRVMPSINCWRGYAEQLVLVLSGHGFAMQCETAYRPQRPRELLHMLGADFNQELDDDSPDAGRAAEFCMSAMQQCDALIAAAYGTRSALAAERQEEGRQAAFDLCTLCRDMTWPAPPASLLAQYGLRPAEAL